MAHYRSYLMRKGDIPREEFHYEPPANPADYVPFTANAKCHICKTPVYRKRAQLKKSDGKAFCSKDCWTQWLHIKPWPRQVLVNCEMCGAELKRPASRMDPKKSKTGTAFCDQQCQNMYFTGENNPNKAKPAVCKFCEQEFIVGSRKRTTRSKYYCSAQCIRMEKTEPIKQAERWKKQMEYAQDPDDSIWDEN